MRKLFIWLDNNILTVLAGFLLVFIPLYPKLPLVDALPGYIVRVRLEDFLVSASLGIWIIWVFRGKTTLKDNPLLKPIIAYLIVGMLSIISAIFLIQTVPLQTIHIEKILLHYFRRIEYFSLFFVFYSSIRSLKQLKVFIWIIVGTTLAVAIYGFGQRYLYWPAFSTMNREFSKGWVLYLTEHARVLSTFGGHYDLAAFIMMALTILWSLFFGIKKIWLKIVLFVIIGCAFWTLILTASRTSFLAYIAGITVMFFFWAFRKGILWSFSRWTFVVVLSMIVMLSFGDLSERFTKLMRLDERLAGIKSMVLSPIGAKPTDKALFLENNPDAALAEITSKSDMPPTPRRPSDVFQDIPLNIPNASGSGSPSAIARTYSQNAFTYDLSSAIRFDALWPMAIRGFKRNILLGSGYSTLNKANPTDFTEAESTDNDFLRSLGETGLLGFITFFGTVLFIVYLIWRNLMLLKDPIQFSLTVGVAGIVIGLLVNAAYIDVFESSKVAFVFWSIAGTTLAGIKLVRGDRKENPPIPHIADLGAFIKKVLVSVYRFFRSDLFLILFTVILTFSLRLYKIQEPLADWHSWRQADTSAVTRNFVYHGINILYPTYDDLSNIASGKDNPKGLRFVEFPLYNVFTVFVDKVFVGYTLEISGRLASIFATMGTVVFLFLLCRKYLSRLEAFLVGFFYAILPYNIFFTRVILPEPFLVFCSTGMIYFWDKFIDKYVANDKLWKVILSFILALIFTLSALLVKPFAIFLFLPMAYLWFRAFGYRVSSLFGLAAFFALSVIPLACWRLWISNFPEGIPASSWLLNGDNIRFKGAFFYWIFADRLVREILGYWGITLLVPGIISRTRKDGWLFIWWGVAILTYVSVLATGNVRHDYYQTMTIPIIVIFMAKGVRLLIDLGREYVSKPAVHITILIIIIFMEMFGWYHIRDLFNINHPEIVEAGHAVELKTKANSLVIAPYMGDTAFLYQTHRAGWPIMQDTIDKMIKMGAQYYVSTNFDDQTKVLMKNALNPDLSMRLYKIIDLTDKYVIIQLVPDNKLPR
jgi:hypothetical protein